MKECPPSNPVARGLVGLLALVCCPSCTTSTPPTAARYVPDAQEARRALEQSLEAWRSSPQVERTVSTVRPVMFVDQQRRPGQRLRAFHVLGESAGADAYRQFRVKLSLEEPDESILVSYYVFGQGPVWVYRAEDLDMLMHMDHAMMAASQPGAEVADPSGGSGAESEHPHRLPTTKAPGSAAGSSPAPR